MKNRFLISPSSDGWQNLAYDEYLLNTANPGELTLLLYVNGRAVIIGRNQNPWTECNVNKLDADGVQLVRRISGGGAVYHDEGNLNFSFLCGRDRYDFDLQNRVIMGALADLRIPCELNGRNDILANGRKFSGYAFCARGYNAMRHGTLLVCSNLTVFDRYLHVSEQKLAAKGVRSVRARVCNLREFAPVLTVDALANALLKSFIRLCGPAETVSFSETDQACVAELYARNASYEWRFGETPAFDSVTEHRFSWGMAQLCLRVESGIIAECRLYTDALDPSIPSVIQPLLTGVPYDANAMARALSNGGGVARELAEYLLIQRN